MDTELLLTEEGLFHTVFPDGTNFVWRLLSLEEYRKFKALKDSGAVHPFILHDEVFAHCFFGNADAIHKNAPAGLTIAIGECIMWLSGDCELQTLGNDIDRARQFYAADSVKENMKRVIFIAWPSYTEEDLVKLSYPELIEKFVRAEHLLQAKGLEYQPLDTKKIYGPGEKPKKGPGQVDFRAENQQIRQTMGDGTHMLDRTPMELEQAQQRNKGKLTRQLARKLDQRHKQQRG